MSESTLNLVDLANGAVQEKLARAMTEVANNILDPNTDATKVRKVTVTLTMKPDANRETVALTADVKNALAPQVGVATTLLVGRDKGKAVVNELKSGVKDQTYIGDDGDLHTDTGDVINENGVIDLNQRKTAKEAN